MDWRAALADPSALRERGLFIAEGRLVLERLLTGAAGGPAAIESVLATPAAVRALNLETQLPGRVVVRTPEEMAASTGFNFHRGVLGLVRRPEPLSVDGVLRSQDASERKPRVFVVADHLVDVDNVGSCFRNARAFGVAGVLVDQRSPDPLYRKAIRTSLGHVLEMRWAQAPMDENLAGLAGHGIATIGLTPLNRSDGRPVQDLAALASSLDPRRPIAVVVGNEGHGLTMETAGACEHLAGISMADGVDSLNVATALAVALYELTRHR